jgi:hypothetical protein
MRFLGSLDLVLFVIIGVRLQVRRLQMIVAEIVYQKIKLLPEQAQKEILDFVEYLERKSHPDDHLWSLISLESALRGLESDTWPDYGPNDLKERWA